MDVIYKKIKPVEELKDIIAELKRQNKKVVHCHGVFDLIHPGHIRHLASAKKEGDILVVTITADSFVKRGPGRPVFNENLRAETLAAMASVDYVAIDHNPTAIATIKAIKPDVYVKGQEYEKKDKDITGKIYDEEETVTSMGGRLAFTYDITFSSSKLINEHLEVHPSATRDYLNRIKNKYPIDQIYEAVKTGKKLKVLVIGDAIIDQYHYCEPLGRSLKENLVVNRYLSEESFPGGVFATANNTAEVCGEVTLVSVLGNDDPFEDYIREHLQPNISPKFFYRDDTPTTIKRRFVHRDTKQKLAQVCYMNDSPITKTIENDIVKYLDKIIDNFDLVIISDFGHGLFNNKLVTFVCERAKYLALNVQTNSSNVGYNLITKYSRANYAIVDEPEIRLAGRDKHGDLQEIMRQIVKGRSFFNLMVTRGPNGSLNLDQDIGFHETPAFASDVVDSIGAGDAFFAFTAPFMATKMPIDLLSFLGNAVGALAVQIVCNRRPVSAVDLMKYATRLLK